MTKRKRRAFTADFKAEAVRLCRLGDRSIAQVAKDLGLTEAPKRRCASGSSKHLTLHLAVALVVLVACADPEPALRAPVAVVPTALVATASASAAPPLPAEPAPGALGRDWFPIVTTDQGIADMIAVGDALLITERSFLAEVRGRSLTQPAALLAGLPETANWDGTSSVGLRFGAVPNAGKPWSAVVLGTHAGNLRGIGFTLVWNGKAWVEAGLSALQDPRHRALVGAYEGTMAYALPSGELFIYGRTRDATDLLVFEATKKQPAKHREVGLELSLPEVSGASSEHLVLCEDGAMFERVRGAWARRPETGVERCALTASGALFFVAGAELFEAKADGAVRVPTPAGERVERLAVVGERLFLRTSHGIRSNVPVDRPVELALAHRPMAALDGIITGLNVTSAVVPNVSRSTPGPGTPACDHLVVHVSTDEPLARELVRRAKLDASRLVTAQAADPGGVGDEYVDGRTYATLIPSKKTHAVHVVHPTSYEEGAAIVAAMREGFDAAFAPPTLVCALEDAVMRVASQAPSLKPGGSR